MVGNTNGIFIVAGAAGNTFRGNLVEGNPGVQIGVDHPSTTSGFDILNLATAGANTFDQNICLTSVNAPCPSVAPPLTANPNPIPVAGNAVVGATTINWSAPDAQDIEIHIGSPNGPLFVSGGTRGSAQTGVWVADGMMFYLQDVTGGKPLTADNTLTTLVVHLQRGAAVVLPIPGGPHPWAFAGSLALLGVAVRVCGKRVRFLRNAALLAAVGFGLSHTVGFAQVNQTAPRLDQMIAKNASPQELARYVFDTHGCKSCHTIGHDGKLGYTAKGKERAQGFEGCIRMLTAMTVIVQVPEDKRSPQQQQKAARFDEFGCTACHKLSPGKLGLTEMGAKLSHLHLGCVEVEKQVASSPVSPR